MSSVKDFVQKANVAIKQKNLNKMKQLIQRASTGDLRTLKQKSTDAYCKIFRTNTECTNKAIMENMISSLRDNVAATQKARQAEQNKRQAMALRKALAQAMAYKMTKDDAKKVQQERRMQKQRIARMQAKMAEKKKMIQALEKSIKQKQQAAKKLQRRSIIGLQKREQSIGELMRGLRKGSMMHTLAKTYLKPKKSKTTATV